MEQKYQLCKSVQGELGVKRTAVGEWQIFGREIFIALNKAEQMEQKIYSKN